MVTRVIHDLDLLLGTQLKVRLLRALAELRTPVSARQATRLAGVSVKGTQTLDELSQLGILAKQEGTAQHLYQLRREHYLATPLMALFAAEEAKLRDVAGLLREQISGYPAVLSAAVFGSSARGEPLPGSDFDVLVIVKDRMSAGVVLDRLLDIAPLLADRFGARLSPFIIGVEEWRARASAADPFIVRAAREAIPFLGDGTLLTGHG
jgi:predicted nucleotidyltransferase